MDIRVRPGPKKNETGAASLLQPPRILENVAEPLRRPVDPAVNGNIDYFTGIEFIMMKRGGPKPTSHILPTQTWT
jgi:hypothetical protein